MKGPIGAVANYIRSGMALSNLSGTHRIIWQVSELAEKAGVSRSELSQIRRNWKDALARELTPGEDPRYEVFAERCYGKTAIAIGLRDVQGGAQ